MEQTRANENLSQWFNLDEQTPWETGVYEVQNDHCSWTNYSYWNGNKFMWLTPIFSDPHMAFSESYKETQATIVKWRGLASDPNAKPKARGNRKVTRYVVMQHVEDLPIAVFQSKELAIKFAERSKHFCYIEKIRFRTPEAA